MPEIPKAVATAAVNLLVNSLTDIAFRYEGLTAVEKSLVSRPEFQALTKWIEEERCHHAEDNQGFCHGCGLLMNEGRARETGYLPMGPRRYVLRDRVDGTFLVHQDGDGDPPETMKLDSKDDMGLWHRSSRFARVMSAQQAVEWLDEVDGGRILRHRLWILPVTDEDLCRMIFPTHNNACEGDCGGLFRCARCKRMTGWCAGAADDHPHWCDACAVDQKELPITDRPAVRGRKARRGTRKKRSKT